MDSFYQKHVFICVNDYDGPCCNQHHSAKMQKYMKQRCKELDLVGQGKARINQAGCFNRCEFGPVMVIYPEAVWYTWVDKADIDEIIEQHLINNRIVQRLLLP
jgi:(2Fe-2S) ferredoxin